ncbi:hypothetical protein, partial [Pseudomonas sp. CF150]|uniref:hypothetical protein n=1 Tax=Pseudomonas sp. CF150 TaxID=911240 RepID=UPI001C43A09B
NTWLLQTIPNAARKESLLCLKRVKRIAITVWSLIGTVPSGMILEAAFRVHGNGTRALNL